MVASTWHIRALLSIHWPLDAVSGCPSTQHGRVGSGATLWSHVIPSLWNCYVGVPPFLGNRVIRTFHHWILHCILWRLLYFHGGFRSQTNKHVIGGTPDTRPPSFAWRFTKRQTLRSWRRVFAVVFPIQVGQGCSRRFQICNSTTSWKSAASAWAWGRHTWSFQDVTSSTWVEILWIFANSSNWRCFSPWSYSGGSAVAQVDSSSASSADESEYQSSDDTPAPKKTRMVAATDLGIADEALIAFSSRVQHCMRKTSESFLSFMAAVIGVLPAELYWIQTGSALGRSPIQLSNFADARLAWSYGRNGIKKYRLLHCLCFCNGRIGVPLVLSCLCGMWLFHLMQSHE